MWGWLPPTFVLKEGVARIHCYIRLEGGLLERISQTSPGELDSPTEKAALWVVRSTNQARDYV